jgi:membrane fusion protein, multidrug efflux system
VLKRQLEVVKPKELDSDRTMSLPGNVRPLQETALYARASGYVKAWTVDLGDKVTKGQVLAVIETPELDQEQAQLRQTELQLLQTQANRSLAKANLARIERLAPSGVVSQADLEQNQAQAQVADANVKVAEANVAARRANIHRLMQLKGFARVNAPFPSIITQRLVEVGTLVTASNSQPLFRLAEMDPARIFV